MTPDPMIACSTTAKTARGVRTLAALTAALLLGACSQTNDLLAPLTVAEAPKQAADIGSGDGAQKDGSELQKATLYWGQEFAKNPSDLKTGLNYARNLKALGEKQKALGVLQQLSVWHDKEPELAGEYGRLALELDQISIASRLLAVADNPAKPDWKIISARGTVFAKQGDYKQAIAAYERALALSNNQPSVLNNLAMAHAMSGDAAKAEELLRQASTQNGATAKVQQNLALVLGLQGRSEEAKSMIAAAPASANEAMTSDADLLKRVVKVAQKPAPAAFVPAFETETATAITPAPFATSVTRTGAKAALATAGPALRPAVADAVDPQPWQTSVAANASAQLPTR